MIEGQKRFYLVPPTCANLRAFADWSTNKDMDDVFFGDFLREFHEKEAKEASKKSGSNGGDAPAYTYENQLFQANLLPGQTMMIPGGWIHAGGYKICLKGYPLV